MIDPLLSLAISVQSNPGVYALLLGSGISRAAGIPTGWEIVLDLIRKLAQLKGEDAQPDPAAWYRSAFGEEPDYARLLDAVAKSPAERQQLLRTYFEPSDDEREEGLKLPTAAHRAIAKLVAQGYVRVILTTNFDRLTERALHDAGINPTVIENVDKIAGAMPIVHTQCTVFKLHGDYLDTRILNTPEELDRYEEGLNVQLDRVLDEFGLIVCGWSAEWDTALRAAIERCPSRRFTTYWAVRGSLVDAAKSLVQHRRGQVIPIRDADSFFVDLVEKAESLKSLNAAYPLSASVAAATVKRLLVDPMHRIRLHDLFMEEVERVVLGMSLEHFPTREFSNEVFLDQVARYEALTEPLRRMLSVGCHWGDESHNVLWAACVERLARVAEEGGGYQILTKLRRYPAMLCMYAGGIGAVASENFGALRALLVQPVIRENGREKPLVAVLYNHQVVAHEIGPKLPGRERAFVPVNDQLYDVLRDTFADIVPDDARYTQLFDRFEYLMSMVYSDQEKREFGRFWVPVGCFVWRDRSSHISTSARLQAEIESAGKSWKPLQAGLFSGSSERALAVLRDTEEHVQLVRNEMGIW